MNNIAHSPKNAALLLALVTRLLFILNDLYSQTTAIIS